jgi:hypothetical protein
MRSGLASYCGFGISEMMNVNALRADQPKARPTHRIAFTGRGV